MALCTAALIFMFLTLPLAHGDPVNDGTLLRNSIVDTFANFSTVVALWDAESSGNGGNPCARPWTYVTCNGVNSAIIGLNLSGLTLGGVLSPHIGLLHFLAVLPQS